MSDNISKRVPDEIAARELAEFGRLLDAVECGRIPVNARQYRKASVLAMRTLRTRFDVSAIIEACAVSPALTELRECVMFERDVAAGVLRVAVPGMAEPRV